MIRLGLLLPLALLAASLGCLRPSPSPPVVFYTLQPLTLTGAPPARTGLAVEVLPVRLPEVLQRPQMVVARGSGTLGLLESHRWGNPLDQDMQRVLAQDLALLLGSDTVVPSPYGDQVGAAFRVEVEVLSCDARAGAGLTLEALWLVTRAGGGPALAVRRTTLVEPLPGPDAEALATAYSHLVAALAREIAAVLLAAKPG